MCQTKIHFNVNFYIPEKIKFKSPQHSSTNLSTCIQKTTTVAANSKAAAKRAEFKKFMAEKKKAALEKEKDQVLTGIRVASNHFINNFCENQYRKNQSL